MRGLVRSVGRAHDVDAEAVLRWTLSVEARFEEKGRDFREMLSTRFAGGCRWNKDGAVPRRGMQRLAVIISSSVSVISHLIPTLLLLIRYLTVPYSSGTTWEKIQKK